MDMTSASGAISRHDLERMDKHAEIYYEQIRKRTSDIQSIAKNTNFSVEDIKKIKNHIFFTYHDLGAEIPLRFTPSYDMAVSWQRLIGGRNIQEMDIVMLKHELCEIELMAEGVDFDTAHRQADHKHSYAKYLRVLDAREGIY